MVTIAVGDDDDKNNQMRGSSPTPFFARRSFVVLVLGLLWSVAGGEVFFYYVCFESVGHDGRSCAAARLGSRGSGIVLVVGFPHVFWSRRAGWELLFMLIEFQFCCFGRRPENGGPRRKAAWFVGS